MGRLLEEGLHGSEFVGHEVLDEGAQMGAGDVGEEGVETVESEQHRLEQRVAVGGPVVAQHEVEQPVVLVQVIRHSNRNEGHLDHHQVHYYPQVLPSVQLKPSKVKSIHSTQFQTGP